MGHPLMKALRTLKRRPLNAKFWFNLMRCVGIDPYRSVVIREVIQPDDPMIYVDLASKPIRRDAVAKRLHHNYRVSQWIGFEEIFLHSLRLTLQTHWGCDLTQRNFYDNSTAPWNELCAVSIPELTDRLNPCNQITKDILKQKPALEGHQHQDHELRTIIDSMADGLLIVNLSGEVIFVNQAAEKLFNQEADHLIGHSLGIPIIAEGGRAEIDIHLSGQHPIWVEIVCNSTTWQESPAYLISLRDVTRYKQAEEKITRMTLYDTLTDLPNQILFNEQLQQVIALCQREKTTRFAVMFIDLDRFKVINDSWGHSAGDQLLISFARRIEQQLSSSNILARLSGDEFVILLKDVSNLEDVIQVAKRINHALIEPFEIQGRNVFTSVSIGITLGQPGLMSPEDLVREADTAMHCAKKQGGAGYAVFDPQMHHQAMMRLQLETDLRYALQRQELHVYYQPLIDLNANQIKGFEALLRWHHPQKGSVSPSQFIPIAEETGLVIPIGQFVLQQACQQVQRWLGQGLLSSAFILSINLSSKQFANPNLTHQILHTLAETGLPPNYLQLEITESSLMENPTAAASTLQELQANSIRLAIDDFGTGHSSLSYLRRFPVGTLKIDQSFTHRLGAQAEDLEIIQSITSLAHSLKMTVVAEGIETKAQLKHLKTARCDVGQGFLFARALEPQTASQFLQQQHQHPLRFFHHRKTQRPA